MFINRYREFRGLADCWEAYVQQKQAFTFWISRDDILFLLVISAL